MFLFSFLTEHHPISNAIDGTNNWWQSPSIQNGREYHWVTITLDLRQVGQAGAAGGDQLQKVGWQRLPAASPSFLTLYTL